MSKDSSAKYYPRKKENLWKTFSDSYQILSKEEKEKKSENMVANNIRWKTKVSLA